MIEISNTYTNEIQRKEDRFYSTKHGGFGIGTASVTEVVQKAGGYVTFCTEDGVLKLIFSSCKNSGRSIRGISEYLL